MAQRDVSASDVLRVLEVGRGVPGKQQGRRKRKRWQKSREESIEIVFNEESDRFVVITVIAKVDDD